MTRKKWCLIGAAVLGLSGSVLAAVNPVAERYVAPIIKEQLNTAINGTVHYDLLGVDWNGDIQIQNVVLKDKDNRLIAAVPDVEVDLKLSAIPSIVLGNASGAAIISEIMLEKPEIHVWQLPDETWNVESLVKPTPDSDKAAFDAAITIKEGFGKARIQSGEVHTIKDINGTVLINTKGLSRGALNGFINGEQLSASGSIDMEHTNNFDLFIDSKRLDISSFASLIPIKQDVTIKSGMLRDVKAQITSREGALTLAGNFSFDGVNATFHNGHTSYEITDGNGRVFLQEQDILIARSHWLVNGQAVKVNGLVDLDEQDIGLNLNVVVDSADIGAFIDNGVTGTMGGRLHINGTSVNPYVAGQLQSSGITYGDYSIDRATATISYGDGIVFIKNADLFSGDGRIAANGRYDVGDGSFIGTANLYDVDLLQLTQPMGEPLGGTLRGIVSVKGAGNEVQRIGGYVTGRDINARGVVIDTMKVGFSNVNNQTTLSVVGNMGAGQFSGDGTINGNHLDLTVSGYELDASRFGGFLGAALDGAVNVYARLDGPLENVGGTARISSSEVHFKGARYNAFDADVALSGNVLTIREARAIDGNGAYTATGTVNVENQSLELTVDAHKVRVENLIRPFTDIPLTGWLESRNYITGTMDNPYIRGRAHLSDGSLYGKLISDAEADYTIENRVLHLPSFTIQGYGATVTGSGTASEDTLNLSFEGNEIDLQRLLINTDYDVAGYLWVKGTVQGSPQQPIFNGSVRSRSLTINGERISNITGDVYADSTVVNLQNLSFDEEHGGHYVAKGGITIGETKRLFGSLDVQEGRVNNLLSLVGSSLDTVDGALSGTVELGGIVGNPSMYVQGTIKDVSIDKTIVGDAVIDAGLENRKFTIKTAKLPVDNGVIAAQGAMDFDGQSDVQIAIRDVNIVPFLPLIGEDIPATGVITGVVNMTGETRNPKIELSAALANGSYNGVAIDQGFVLATMEDRIINIQRIQGSKDVYKLSAYGKIPLAALYTSGYLDASDSRAMDVVIDFNEADMGVFPLVLADVKEAAGDIKGNIHITGTIDQPEAYGTVSIRNGMMKVNHLGNAITNFDGDLIFSGQQGDFQSRFVMGKGAAGLSAKINWQGHTLINYNMAAQLDGIDLANEYISGPLRGELYIADRDSIPTLMGRIDLENMKLKIPLSLESSDSTQNMGMDVTVHAGKNVRLYDRSLYDMRINGDVHFGGSVLYPEAHGQFTVNEGIFKYLSHTFTITKGTANFMQGSYLPRLQLEAETNANNYNILLGVTGTVDQLDLSLKSTPPLSRQQIVSMLTFGRGTESKSSSISDEDANALAIAGVQMFAFGYVQDALQNTLGLDRVNITTGSIDPDEPTNRETAGNYNIEIGKYVLPRTMVTFTQGINNHQNKYGIEYTIRRNLKFTGWHTSKGNTYFGGRWSKEF